MPVHIDNKKVKNPVSLRKNKKKHTAEDAMYKPLIITGIIILATVFSGCIDSLFTTPNIYQDHPTQIGYTIEYGYQVTCNGDGKYTILYDCDIPDVTQGSASPIQILHTQDYQQTTRANNTMIQWNITNQGAATYTLGLKTMIISQALLTADLMGTNAVTLQEIAQYYPDYITQYCNKQATDTTTYIDPSHPGIQAIATQIQSLAGTNNSFILAKELFRWLKQTTSYQNHTGDEGVQSAAETFTRKNGDCDDLSLLYISLCRSLQIPARLIRGYLIEETAGIPTAVAHAWVHVFTGGNLGFNGWIPVECAGNGDPDVEIHQNFGVKAANHLRLFTGDGTNQSLELSLSGISWTKYANSIDITATSFADITNYTILTEQQLTVTDEGHRSYQ